MKKLSSLLVLLGTVSFSFGSIDALALECGSGMRCPNGQMCKSNSCVDIDKKEKKDMATDSKAAENRKVDRSKEKKKEKKDHKHK